MKRALKLFSASKKVAVLAVLVLMAAGISRADKTAASHSASSSGRTSASTSTGTSSTGATKKLKSEVSALHEQFKTLIEEVSALQDRVTGIQTSLDELDGSR